MKSIGIAILVVLFMYSMEITYYFIEVHHKFREIEQELVLSKELNIRLNKDRIRVKEILRNDTTNLAKYY